MVNTSGASAQRASIFRPSSVAKDYAYVMPGFFISLFGFIVLLPLFLISVSTLIIWIGALLLPLTLTIASGFASLSRARLRSWGHDVSPARYAPRSPGLSGWVKQMADPRRWLDLAFEGLVAFPLRLFTFTVATVWTFGAVGGITYVIWAVFLPQDDTSLADLLFAAFSNGAVVDAGDQAYLIDAGINLLAGCLLLVTIPPVMRGLALLDAATAAVTLGGPSATYVEAATAEAPGSSPFAQGTAPATGSPARAQLIAQPSPLSGDGWSWVAVVFTVIATFAIGWPLLAVIHHLHVAVALLAVAMQATALLLAIRLPLAGIIAQTIATVGTAVLIATTTVESASGVWPWPVMSIIVQAVFVLLVALRRPWPWAAAAWAAPQAGLLLAILLFGLGPTGDSGSVGAAGSTASGSGVVANLIVAASVTLGIAAGGAVLRLLATSRGALREQQQANAELSAQQRELDERTRIAQELHDVVAHSMSVISVQATTAPYRLSDLDPAAAEEFESVAQSSRRALAEMRSLLTLLRSSDGDREAPLVPQPTFADIPALVDGTRRSGATIALRGLPVGGDPGASGALGASDASDSAGSVHGISAAVGLTTYRIVQEALSNAVRHAPRSEIEVTIDIAGEAADDAGSAPAATRSAVRPPLVIDIVNGPPAPPAGHTEAPGAGLGLAGLRERAGALGGSVESGATPGGGFRVRAILPRD